MYLFLDSSTFIQVGVLNEDLTWKHHEVIRNKKGSHIIHSVIYSALKECGIKTHDLKGIFLANGPGSYTGIRVAEGLSQVLELEGIPVYSFYHFEVPSFCGLKDYEFFAEAFKGEVFSYRFDGEEEIKLMKEEEFQSLDLLQENQFHLEGPILGKELNSLYDYFQKHSTDIFSKVLERAEHKPPYYFRSAEKEFKIPQK